MSSPDLLTGVSSTSRLRLERPPEVAAPAWSTDASCNPGESIVASLLNRVTRKRSKAKLYCGDINKCANCCEYASRRQVTRIRRDVSKRDLPGLYVVPALTSSHWDTAMQQRKRTGNTANYIWVLHRDGTRLVVTDENLTPRTCRLAFYSVGEALDVLGLDYRRYGSVKRWPTPRWRVRKTNMRIIVGNSECVDEAWDRAGYGGGIPEDEDLGQAAKRVRAEYAALQAELAREGRPR